MITGGGGSSGTLPSQGAAAAKPANPSPGQLYFATDTLELWVGNLAGNGWQSLGQTSVATNFVIPNSSIRIINGGAIVAAGGSSGISTLNNNGIFVTTTGGHGVDVQTVGAGLLVAEGSNAKQGITAAMTAGAVTVSNTSVTANSRILVTRAPGGTNPGAVYVSAQTAGSGFTVTSTNASDTGQVYFQIFEPG